MADTAVSELERNAAAGDPQAQFELAQALLRGPEATAEGPRAIALVDRAVAAGHAEAMAMAALFEAMWRGTFTKLAAGARPADPGGGLAVGGRCVRQPIRL